jgi:hypothetical protein
MKINTNCQFESPTKSQKMLITNTPASDMAFATLISLAMLIPLATSFFHGTKFQG